MINRFSDRFEIPDSYTLSRTLVLNRSGVVEVFPISSDEYFFFGLDLAIIKKIINQNFSDIIDYRCDFPKSFEVTVNAKLKSRDLEEYNINVNQLPQATDRSRVIMTLSGTLHSNSAGVIFGKLSQAAN
ncbi:hypothetical protein A0J48_003680 [Sphaerospermopsis aphanizomenoides BCCUSP55]|uniref:hypothetical protein n=1 Tax=Sphaerospermopsis aphanizomenoides TaxID=459663 RepID=UPI0019085622|nr:hypothetical protein [Sphaerospermopsis aphanizomenoides]MBK1986649.1 hypothetical protein [Sphaerospermopsis aphanizomenoides BCCUSP55]